MSMQAINDQLKAKLQAITGIQNVYDFAWVDFDGFPAATITPSGFDSNYETNIENERVYIFVIRLFYNVDVINKTTIKEKVEEGFRVMRGMIDTVTDELDKDSTLQGITLPTGKTMLQIKPTPTSISYFPEEKIIVGEVNVETLISFDTTS